MDLSRLRPGDLLAALSAVALLVLLCLDWVRPEASLLREAGAAVPAPLEGEADAVVSSFVERNAEVGWTALGWPVVALLVLVALGGLAVAAGSALRLPVALPIAASVLTSGLGIITLVVLLVRLTLAQPDLDLGLEDEQVDVLTPALLGLLALLGTTAGAWLAMADERTDAPGATAPEVPVRPAPAG